MWRLGGVALISSLVALGAAAQEQSQPQLDIGRPAGPPVTTLEVPSPIVTVDPDRLFSESAWGKRVLSEVELRSNALAAENRLIEEELNAEEQALTRLRAEMEPAQFIQRAAAFDSKVLRLRRESDDKIEDLEVFLDSERQRFFSAVPTVLGQLLREMGAVAIIDDSAIVMSVVSIDITEAAIARADSGLGDGRQQ